MAAYNAFQFIYMRNKFHFPYVEFVCEKYSKSSLEVKAIVGILRNKSSLGHFMIFACLVFHLIIYYLF